MLHGGGGEKEQINPSKELLARRLCQKEQQEGLQLEHTQYQQESSWKKNII